MKRILVSEAGGALTRNFVNSLKKSKESYYFIGVSSHKYEILLSDADENYLVPHATDKAFIPILKQIISETKPNFLHSQHDVVIEAISEHINEIPVKTFLPSTETIKNCTDKFKSYNIWKLAGLKVPQTINISSEADLKRAFQLFGNKIWLRSKKGGGGFGSLPTDDFEFAKSWIDYYKGWGKFSAAEYLSPDSITWMSIWKNGKLVVAQSRRRLYWLFSKITVSGVTGITGAAETFKDPLLDDIAIKAILSVDNMPHGIFSVDLTYDAEGIPNPTEINIGRFFTTHQFFTEAGLNMPEIYVKLAFDEEIPHISPVKNPLKSGLVWIRGMDTKPVLTTIDKVELYQQQLEKRLKSLEKMYAEY